jgi:hypothetical protein
MKDESHLQEMRAAVRGDRERAQRRRHVEEPAVADPPAPEPPVAPANGSGRRGFFARLRRRQ